MLPSEFFALVPEIRPDLLGLREDPDDDDRAVALVGGIVRAALVDLADLTGGPAEPPPASDARGMEAFVCLLSAAALRARARTTAADAVALHNPDVGQQSPVQLDLVRVIGRASRADMQRARRLLGRGWFSDLVDRRGR